MNRRTFLKSLAAASTATLAHLPLLQAALPKMKITRVRAYKAPEPNPLFNQSNIVVTIETDAGITGIGEGGFPDTLNQCAGRLIGQDPQYIERLWQDMSRSFFYPPGREKQDALGALDLALWDIRGKAAQSAGSRNSGRRHAELLRVLQHRWRCTHHQTGDEPEGTGRGDD
jgi:L-alanine-DL-glutamate epimerase-like enolase superfamily enzyme